MSGDIISGDTLRIQGTLRRIYQETNVFKGLYFSDGST